MKTKFFSYLIASFLVILLLLPTPILATEAGVPLTEYTFEDMVTTADLPDNDDLFAGYVEKTLYPNQTATFGISARARLSEQDRSLYDAIKVNLDKIANGETDSAMFDVSVKDLSNIENGYYFSILDDSFIHSCFEKFWSQFDFDAIFNALLHDCTYEFYWFDKTEGGGLIAYRPTYISPVKIGFELTFSFCVAQDYQPNNYNTSKPTVNLAKTKATKGAVNRATAIVKQYERLADYDKLKAYSDTICNLVDYDTAAASDDYDGGYGDPWQLIYVFDSNPNTKVVCEGYSKAFQYLCDLSVFDGNICCYTITGGMDGGTGAGGHMWNIVTMGDKKNYLVDITNSDKGTVGENGQLFLAGTNGAIQGGYQFSLGGSRKISFLYTQTMVSLWGSDQDSILNLAASNYNPEDFHVEYVEIADTFHDKMVIEKSHDSNDDLVLKIEPKGTNELPEILHYVLVYDSHNILKDIRQIPCVVGDDGITLTVSDPHVKPDETYKVIVWADNQAPLIHAISDIAK